ncbi:hypothetical protein llap_9573 [Limosa lapponica baueri]|uniref:Rna-directed dna polymerase from mobile element jockey-like n=1 Tax=Limosa lapponica baueri TaxID=1758121 RepID=A0A2I0U220_LIMLA|nr:hypothetical protein llap_9573 [Limosa lapponica baueri]
MELLEKSSVKSHYDDEGTGASHIWGKAGRAGTAQPGEEKDWGADLINVYKYLKGGCKDDRARLFLVVPSDGTRGSRHNLKHMRSPLNIRKHFVSVQVIKHWHRLPREVVESPPLEILKNFLNMVLGSLL